ncbi:MAG: tryptophan synthase subunit alpha [Bacteroidota bacterium]
MESQVTTNRIDQVFNNKENILNIYFTAGFPKLDDTLRVAKSLEEAGADILEIGIPFSDPLADGPTIQDSSQKALENGMSLRKLFDQLQDLRTSVTIPVLLMGYINPILQFGIKEFCEECGKVGIDGVIVPDLPMHEYQDTYRSYFEENGIHNIFLISPNTSTDRIRLIDENSGGFIYMVSSSSITGAKSTTTEGQVDYYKRVAEMKLKNPRLIGFGISNKETFLTACQYANGAIIGSAFINLLNQDASDEAITTFIQSIKS